MGRTRPPYASEFRRQMIELVRAGRTPEELARERESASRGFQNGQRFLQVFALMAGLLRHAMYQEGHLFLPQVPRFFGHTAIGLHMLLIVFESMLQTDDQLVFRRKAGHLRQGGVTRVAMALLPPRIVMPMRPGT